MAVLILGGTQEARELKALLGDDAILALARTTRFGGAEGLAAYVEQHGITTIVDATHPFATRISANAQHAGVRVIRLERPGFVPEPGDDWTYVDTLAHAELPADARVFLTTGHHEVEALDAHPAFFLVRALNPPPTLPPHHELILAKGPFDLSTELALIERHQLTHLVTKDSGGPDAKLQAARAKSLRVVLIRRPLKPPVATTAETPEAVSLLLSD
ncbi:precorrin-6A/cobalt-precorrin-6A reductase [Solirubrobacter phytolaccae]|uniref:Precorrin-6A/cobalt-precorrin-6A reductase n=1 Tax=Solirubrobacter phytolaccae TaxID=1404360 RepID=A0A9X3SC27_9ACTN|nr:precorrin-6A/cobalt-precorrin-6A reductase [Solirubrobacter phytolaccae]MDA0182045.1 precorrin-6A/cobalt-precorrin-6A reductase [Solirubrobacter phytolaccae]